MSDMLITNQNLTRVAQKLIEQKTLVSSKYNVVGNPIITHRRNGYFISSLSKENYAEYSSLSLSDISFVDISCGGDFYSSETKQCLWSLSNSDFSNNLYLIIENNSLDLYLNNNIIANVYTFINTNFNSIKINLKLESNTFEVSLSVDNSLFTNSGNLLNSIDITEYTYISFGSSSYNREFYWNGSIELSAFNLTTNTEYSYSPSNPIQFHFTKLMISDGTIDLSDNTVPVLNHIYAFDVVDLQRTNNTILLKTTIPEDVYLNIAEFGLFIRTEDGNQSLFSVARGYSLKKEKGLGYDLLFKIDLSISVVNTIAFPEFIVKEIIPANFNTFFNIKKVYLYIITNLERIIRANATELGYARELKVNQTLNSVNISITNFKSSYVYSLLKKDINYNIQDFYTFFDYPFSFYSIKNLNYLADVYNIKVVDNLFKGKKDSINFSSFNDFSLVLKVNLKDTEDKYIFGKVNFNSSTIDKYCTLELTRGIQNNYVLSFKYYTQTEELSLDAIYNLESIGSLVDKEVLITITSFVSNGNRNFYMYVNKDLISSGSILSSSTLPQNLYSISNYIPQDDESLDNKIYVQNILSFDRVLYTDDIYYIGNLLGIIF